MTSNSPSRRRALRIVLIVLAVLAVAVVVVMMLRSGMDGHRSTNHFGLPTPAVSAN